MKVEKRDDSILRGKAKVLIDGCFLVEDIRILEGKSGLFISTKYGSKVRLATVLTNAPIHSENEVVKNGCGNCDKCVKACPAGAISGKIYSVSMDRSEFFSAEKCSHNMKNYKDIGRGAVCGICIKVCPYNNL